MPWDQRFLECDAGPGGQPARFADPKDMIVAWTAREVPDALAALDAARADGLWVAGFASYELGYALMPKLADAMPTGQDTPLLAFGLFDGPSPVSSDPVKAGQLGPIKRARWLSDYAPAFDRLHDHIGAGDIYQANLTIPFDATYTGDIGGIVADLVAEQPVRYGAVVNLGEGPVIASRSPELFFATDAAGRIETRPMKGTAARGATPDEDAERKSWLANDEKNQAENLMIVDLLRNDLSRICKVGSVKVPELFHVETYETVHQMVSKVQAQLSPNTGLADILRALFPCGSITGAPKLRAMEIIRELETAPRGVYCGSIGWMAPDGASCFNVAIRTLSFFEDGRARLNAGGGVVWDSEAKSEYEELLWKTRFAQISPKG